MREALAAAYAVVGLAQTLDALVIGGEECFARTTELPLLHGALGGYVALVVMYL